VRAVDNCDDNPTVTADPPSGSFFHVGPTLVTITAKDHDGNTSTCTFTVTVAQGGEATVGSVKAVPCVLWPPNHKMSTLHQGSRRFGLSVNDVHCRSPRKTTSDR
jgi:hypothetical protein